VTDYAVNMMQGLGDTIYLRAFITAAPEDATLWLKTAWPELFEDCPRVRCVRSRTRLRTQALNEARSQVKWHDRAPKDAVELSPRYKIGRNPILERLAPHWPWPAGPMSLPKFEPIIKSDKPIAVVRPVTLRREWLAPARNPDPVAVCQVSKSLMRSHHVVSVADIDGRYERLVGELPEAHERYDHGQLDVKQLLGLIQQADMVVGGVGWIVPACLAARVRCWVVLGGCLEWNSPDSLGTDEWMKWIFPDHPCKCGGRTHDCGDDRKRVSNIPELCS